MSYQAVYLYTGDNEFVGAAIKKTDVPKLDSVNIWQEGEEVDFKQTLDALNDEYMLKQFWPDVNDPDVAALIENSTWEPLKLEEADVPDWEASTVVDDDWGGIDYMASNIVYVKALIPRPEDATARVHKAQEVVARQRASVDNSDAA